MTDPRTPTERLADQPLGAVSSCDEECDLCGRPATHDGTLCSGCFDERWEFDTAAEQDAHARVMRLTLRGECIRCGSSIEDGLRALGSTECQECRTNNPRTAAA